MCSGVKTVCENLLASYTVRRKRGGQSDYLGVYLRVYNE